MFDRNIWEKNVWDRNDMSRKCGLGDMSYLSRSSGAQAKAGAVAPTLRSLTLLL
jgi:hypothetical protein